MFRFPLKLRVSLDFAAGKTGTIDPGAAGRHFARQPETAPAPLRTAAARSLRREPGAPAAAVWAVIASRCTPF